MKTRRMILLVAVLFIMVLSLASCDSQPQTDPEHVHEWIDATCTAPKTCATCHETEGNALGHTEVTMAGAAATCSEPGLTEGKKCSVCGEITVPQETIPVKQHTETMVMGKSATCTTAGLTDGRKCSVCGEITVPQETIPAEGHQEETVKATEATCTEPGLTEGKRCTVCGEITLAQETIPAQGHQEETLAGKAPTCTERGLTEGKQCSVCGEITLAQETLPVEGHTEEIIKGQAATCTEPGMTDGKRCTVCGEILVQQQAINALGHTDQNGNHTCDHGCGLFFGQCVDENKDHACDYGCPQTFGQHEAAEGSHICTYCNQPASECTGAAAVEENIVEATCGAAGSYDSVVYCSVCGEELSREAVTVPATGKHIWIEGTPLAGTRIDTCDVCGMYKLVDLTPDAVENIFAGKLFVPTAEADAQVLRASWFKGGGYETLTDGNKIEEQVGRFSTLMNNTSAFMEATIDLRAGYELGILRFYLYDTKDSITEESKKASIGKDLLIQVYANGVWTDVITCADNASLCQYLVINEGFNNDYLEFDLGGIAAEKVRFFISASVSDKGITFQEIECSGKKAYTVTVELPEADVIENVFAGKGPFVPSDDTAANIYSATYGYQNINDGSYTTRYSSKQNGGKVEATLALGGVYDLYDLKFYLYSDLAEFGTGLEIQVLYGGQWTTVVSYTAEELSAFLADKVLSIDLGGAPAIAFKFVIPSHGSAGWTTFYEIECSAKLNAHQQHTMLEATCTTPSTCSVCGITEGEPLPHTEVIDAAVPATCTTTGLTEGKHCDVCGTVLVAQQVIPMHNFVDGVCKDCGLIYNFFAGKQFVPTEDALASVLSAGWWHGGGYETLTDGIKNADNAPGRFATVMATTGMMDATLDFGIAHELYSLRFYTYDPNGTTGAASLGASLLIQVYADGEWIDVVTCADNAAIAGYLVVNEGTYNDYLEFNLGGVKAEKIRFYISASVSASGTSYEEIECSGTPIAHEHSWDEATCTAPKTCSTCGATEGKALGHDYQNGVCTRCGETLVLIDNLFTGKQFVPTEEAVASVLSKSWWKGGGYETLTDGIKNADNAPGRFSTVMATTGMMDATIDLGGIHELHSLRFYTYDPAAGTTAASLGADLLIQIYADGEWFDVVTCADNASINGYLVVNEGTYNDYLEFDLGGVKAEKIRFYISASASVNGTTYEEIECSGYSLQ